jgi:hypothetical protein
LPSSSNLRNGADRALAAFSFLSYLANHSRWLTITGWVTTAAFLVLGVPLFLRMPLCCDSDLYEVGARTILSGGVHYRDVFDTNPPGFPWLICAVRLFVGTGSEAVRIVDLAIVLGVSAYLLVLARSAGATSTGIAWTAAAIASFYPFIHEYNHVQRDAWMMLPAIGAIALRLRRIDGVRRPNSMSFLEGLLWGLGCWIKPHLLIIAACVWLVTAVRFVSTREALRDLAAVFAGGVSAGLMGLAWLVGTGAWPYFLDVWRNWNTAYAKFIYLELTYRIFVQQLNYFPPYSCFLLLAVPLSLRNLRDRSSPDPVRFRRAVLAAIYLSWMCTSLFLQRGYHYIHIPETLLMLAVFAANRWPVSCATVLSQILVGIFFLATAPISEDPIARDKPEKANAFFRSFAHRNEAFNPDRTRWWSECFGGNPSRELRKGLGMWVDHFGGIDPVEIGAVADYLRSQDVRDGELITWHDSPHELYLLLDIKPGIRFMHVGTAYRLGDWQGEQILRELQAAIPRARFTVSDLYSITRHRDHLNDVGPDGLSPRIPPWQRAEFPFNQPVVFRSPSGRHLVHKITKPVTSCVMPEKLDQESP